MCHVSSVRCHVTHVICHVKCVACRVSPVTCHMSLTPTTTARDPTPANCPTLCTAVWFRKKKKIQIYLAGQFLPISEPKLQILRPFYVHYTLRSLLLCNESFCNRSWCPRTFVNGSNMSFKKYTCDSRSYKDKDKDIATY